MTDAGAAARADAEASATLLRCWVRETGAAPVGSALHLDLPVSGLRLWAPVHHRSATGTHRFGPARFASGAEVPAVALAALLGTELATIRGGSATQIGELTARVADSTARIAAHLAADGPADRAASPFLAAEQCLVLGHPLHPTPKSRPGLTDDESARYSPELGGNFALHWFAADRAVVCGDSALASSAQELLAGLGAPPVPDGFVAVPAHPWQARDVRRRAVVRDLLDTGRLRDLGPAGAPWWPTSSLRTVYRPDAPVMLKFSLGLAITNSRRNQLRTELARGLEVHRLLEAGLAAELHRAHPGFDVVRDPAWLAVATGAAPTGLEIVVRENPFRGTERVACVAGLVADRPDRADGRSMLARIVHHVAQRDGRGVAEAAQEWFARYLRGVVEPVLWLYHHHGLGLEAHQQNTLVLLDEDGLPIGGRYRDNQGYYFSAERADGLSRWLPGAGRELGTWCPDAVIDERLGYYVGINNVLGVIGAMGAQRLGAEEDLLAQVRRFLRGVDGPLAAHLADAESLRCKANLLTRVQGMDELVGPVDSQSVYVDIPNPIRQAGS